ncbi:MAG TPA: DUF4233 domain-containing protein [Pseudonocardiaceae bacterium]|nr:DUF4233 domain-containing protein [Pseudonocardiaceae bacterium]
MSERPDPLRALRGICAGILIMEAIVVGLALLVIGRLGGGLGPGGVSGAGWYTGSLALAMALAAGLQRHRWGVAVALALQLAMVFGWFAHPALGGLGLLFALVWGYLLYVRRAVERLPASTPRR